MDHAREAQRLFLEGYNCAQAVFCAFIDFTGLDIKTAARFSSSFGAGIGRLRETCGAVSGALMALGMVRGYSDPADSKAKVALYALVQDYVQRFRDKNGTFICRELLKDVPVTPGLIPESRTPEFYARRPCLRLIGEAAALLEKMLSEEQNTCPKEEQP